jgi:L-cystine uptake protein TcyP (sodium:dicarboxylate symporter family)
MTRSRSITFLATAAVLLLSAVAVAGCGGGATAHAAPPKTASGQPATLGRE